MFWSHHDPLSCIYSHSRLVIHAGTCTRNNAMPGNAGAASCGFMTPAASAKGSINTAK